MAREVRLKKTTFNKEQYSKAIDNKFKTFISPAEEVDTDTVEEFFRLYSKLFYEIPVEGESNSHQYILKESSKLVDFDKDTSEIQPLLDEITDLRERLLQTNTELIEIQTQQFTDEQN